MVIGAAGRVARGGGKRDGERRALAFAGAFGVNGAAMQLDDMPHDRQSNAQPAVRARAGAVGLAETIEDEGEELWVDTAARVADAQPQRRVDAVEPHLDS